MVLFLKLSEKYVWWKFAIIHKLTVNAAWLVAEVEMT